MGRNNTKAAKNIAKMYEQLGLAQDDIFHKAKLLLSIYRDVVWATLSDCECVNEEIYYYGDDLNDALIYLEEFAPDIERSEFERRVCNLFENKWIVRRKSDENPTDFLLKVRLCLCYTVYAAGLHPHFGCCKKRIGHTKQLQPLRFVAAFLLPICRQQLCKIS